MVVAVAVHWQTETAPRGFPPARSPIEELLLLLLLLLRLLLSAAALTADGR